MAHVTSDGQPRPPLTSHLRDIRQTGCDVMSVLVSQEADMLLANLAYGHGSGSSFYTTLVVIFQLLHLHL